jgi:polysaccharide biosynthesis transport protein
MADFSGVPVVGRAQALSLRDAVFVIFRRRFVIAAIALPIILVASLGLFKNTGSFVAACQILLDLQAPEAPRWNTRAYVDYERSLSTYQHMAMSVPVSKLAAASLQDSLEIIRSLGGGTFAHLQDVDALASYLGEHLDVAPVGESSILDFRFGSSSTRMSLMSVAACRDAFMSYSISATKNTHALEYYDEQVRIVRDEVDDLLSQRADVISRAGFGIVENDLKAETGHITEMRDTLFKNQIEASFLESKVRSMRRAFDANPDFYPTPGRDDEAGVMIGAKDQVEVLRSELDNMLSKYTEDHVEVQRHRERLDKAREVLHREVEAYIAGYEMNLVALNAQAVIMQQQIGESEARMTFVPEVDRQVSLIDTEVTAKIGLLKDLQLKRGEVLINAGADERVTTMVKLTEPEIDVVITEARKFVYFALVSLFGIIFAIVIGFIIDYQDHRLYAPDRMEAQLGVPVLGAVSDERAGGSGS